MTELWLIRHGQTDWNTEGRIQGSIDQPLNECGIDQAKELAAKLDGNEFAAVYSSPAIRAFQTAAILMEGKDIQIHCDERLKEINLGIWEGLTWQEVEEEYPELLRKREADPERIAPPGSENYSELAERMVEAVNDIAAAHPDERVLVVSHGMTIASLICKVHGLPLKQAYNHVPKNADPVVLPWKGNFTIG
jgi:alpha-ribazole phosphatase/probable phosphoglycerate mutase